MSDMKSQSTSGDFKLRSDASSKASFIQPTSSSSIQDTTPSPPIIKEKIKENRTIEAFTQSMRTTSSDRKWLYASIISLVALLLFSTFSVRIMDQFLYKRGIDLFSSETNKYQVYLTIAQFVLLFGFIRVIFMYL